jgi:hypothetical protein
MKKLSCPVFLGIFLLLLPAVGCLGPKHITNLPPGVSETEVRDWYAATAALNDVSKLTKAATDAVISLHKSKSLPGGEAEYQSVLETFAKIDQVGIHASNTLKGAAQNFGSVKSQVKPDVQSIADQLTKALADNTLKTNATTKTILQSLQLAVVALQVASGF